MKTTPTLGLKLYDPTDAPDLVSGYNASMGTLDAKRLFRYLGTLQNSNIDLNNCHNTGYWNNYEYDFTEANHGPVGSFNRGILVVYDKCNGPSAQGKCLRQEYYPEPYGTGDAYRPMVRTLNSDNDTWTAWKPLVDVPEVPDNVVAYNDNTKRLSVNGTEVAALKMRSIEGLELLNGKPYPPVFSTNSKSIQKVSPALTEFGFTSSTCVVTPIATGREFLGVRFEAVISGPSNINIIANNQLWDFSDVWPSSWPKPSSAYTTQITNVISGYSETNGVDTPNYWMCPIQFRGRILDVWLPKTLSGLKGACIRGEAYFTE